MGIELEVIQDRRIMNTINSAKRGGLSLVIQRLCMTDACGEYYRNTSCGEEGRRREEEESGEGGEGGGEEEWWEEEGKEGEESTSILYLGNYTYLYVSE